MLVTEIHLIFRYITQEFRNSTPNMPKCPQVCCSIKVTILLITLPLPSPIAGLYRQNERFWNFAQLLRIVTAIQYLVKLWTDGKFEAVLDTVMGHAAIWLTLRQPPGSVLARADSCCYILLFKCHIKGVKSILIVKPTICTNFSNLFLE